MNPLILPVRDTGRRQTGWRHRSSCHCGSRVGGREPSLWGTPGVPAAGGIAPHPAWGTTCRPASRSQRSGCWSACSSHRHPVAAAPERAAALPRRGRRGRAAPRSRRSLPLAGPDQRAARRLPGGHRRDRNRNSEPMGLLTA